MTAFKAVFGVEAFQAWNEFDAACFDEEPDSLSDRLGLLHQQLYSRGRESRAQAKKEYDKRVNPVESEIGDRVLFWTIELSKAESMKILKLWIGPYKVNERLRRVGNVLESEVGRRIVRAHANRLRRTGRGFAETGEPSDGVFPDYLRTFEKISDVQWRCSPQTGKKERHFKVQVSGRRSSKWTRKSDFP